MKPVRSMAALLAAFVTVLPAAAMAQATTAPDAPAAAGATAEPAAQPPAPALTTGKDLTSYAVGVSTGRALRSADGAEVNFDALVRGLRDGLEGNKLQLTERRVADLLGQFQQSLRQKMMASRARAKVENLKAAHAFLDDNRSKPGIVSLDSGVQYRIISTGTGRNPTEADAVTVNYRGTLLNGKEFDATEPGHPARLTVSGLIAGWKQVLKLMPVGSHWEVFIPPELGYGERGVGGDIGPNELLKFDLELLATKPSDH